MVVGEREYPAWTLSILVESARKRRKGAAYSCIQYVVGYFGREYSSHFESGGVAAHSLVAVRSMTIPSRLTANEVEI